MNKEDKKWFVIFIIVLVLLFIGICFFESRVLNRWEEYEKQCNSEIIMENF